MNYLERFKVLPGTVVKLKDVDPSFKGHHDGRKEAAEEIEHYRKRLRELQQLLYADGRRSLLVCLQAMDGGGKDGAINHVLGAMNPQGCRVAAFKQPTAEELAHDFLWRVHPAAPRRGAVAIFNRHHTTLTAHVDLRTLGYTSTVKAHDLWLDKDTGPLHGIHTVQIPAHGVVFLKLTQ